jgi:hypothetical protein
MGGLGGTTVVMAKGCKFLEITVPTGQSQKQFHVLPPFMSWVVAVSSWLSDLLSQAGEVWA